MNPAAPVAPVTSTLDALTPYGFVGGFIACLLIGGIVALYWAKVMAPKRRDEGQRERPKTDPPRVDPSVVELARLMGETAREQRLGLEQIRELTAQVHRLGDINGRLTSQVGDLVKAFAQFEAASSERHKRHENSLDKTRDAIHELERLILGQSKKVGSA